MVELDIQDPTSWLRFSFLDSGFEVEIDQFFKKKSVKEEGVKFNYSARYERKELKSLPKPVRNKLLMDLNSHWKKIFKKRFQSWVKIAESRLEEIESEAIKSLRALKNAKEQIHPTDKRRMLNKIQKDREAKAKKVESALKSVFEKVCNETTEEAFERTKKNFKPDGTVKIEGKDLKGWKFWVKVLGFTLVVIVVAAGVAALVNPYAGIAVLTGIYLVFKGLSALATPADLLHKHFSQFVKASTALWNKLTDTKKHIESCLKDIEEMHRIYIALLDQRNAANRKLQEALRKYNGADEGKDDPKIKQLQKKVEAADEAMRGFDELFPENGSRLKTNLQQALEQVQEAQRRFDRTKFEKSKAAISLLKDLADAAEAIPG